MSDNNTPEFFLEQDEIEMPIVSEPVATSEEDTAALAFAMTQAGMFVRETTTVDDYLADAEKIYKRLKG